ncbi:MAG: hypothetical protein ACJ79H_02085 [Myxococcales bacterium]
MRIRLATRPPYRVRCDDCGAVGTLPRHTLSWWCPRADEVSVLAPDLQKKLAAPYAHLAELGDGSPPRVFLLEPPDRETPAH